MWMRRRIWWCVVICCALSAGACRRGKIERSEAAESLETPVAEALMRHVLETCPLRGAFDSLTIVLGERMEPASAGFEDRFANTGLRVIPHRKLVAGAAAGKVRVFDPDTQQVPVVLQVSELRAVEGSSTEWTGVAAWAWKEESARARYRIIQRDTGDFAFEKVEDIPIVPRNQDFQSDVQSGAR